VSGCPGNGLPSLTLGNTPLVCPSRTGSEAAVPRACGDGAAVSEGGQMRASDPTPSTRGEFGHAAGFISCSVLTPRMVISAVTAMRSACVR